MPSRRRPRRVSAHRGGNIGHRVQLQSRPSLHYLTRKISPNNTFDVTRDGGQLLEIDTGLDPHFMQQVNKIFGTDISCRLGGKGATTDSAERRIISIDAFIQSGNHIDQPNAAGVVKVQSNRQFGYVLLQVTHGPLHNRWRCHPSGVA